MDPSKSFFMNNVLCFDHVVCSLSVSQSHGHSHYPVTDVEEGEKEKLQQNGEASSLALGKVDAGEGELMLSPAQTPQVTVGTEDGGE